VNLNPFFLHEKNLYQLKLIIIFNGKFVSLDRNKMGLVVGISGVSRAGKTTLSKQIKKWYSGLQTAFISMDEFVFPVDQIPKINNEVDWEVPASVDYDKLYDHLTDITSFNDIIIAEGILIFNNENLNSLFNKRIHVEIAEDIYFERKRNDKRWKVPDWYIKHIWDSYGKYRSQATRNSLKVDGTIPLSLQKMKIMDFLNI